MIIGTGSASAFGNRMSITGGNTVTGTIITFVMKGVVAMNKSEKREAVPVWERSMLTLEEAAAYTGIGVRKLRQMTDSPTCD